MATQDVEVLQVNTQPAQQSVAGLRNEIKRLKGELLSLEQGSKEYNEVLTEVANKTHQLKEITEEVNRSSADFGDRLRNVQGTVAGVSGAFQTVLGSLSLMGVQIGDDVKMLKMLQSAMAITQGVAAIDSGVKAFKALTISIKASVIAMSGLKKALITSGIGAAAVAVGILVSKMSELKKESENAANSLKESFDNAVESISKLDKELDRHIRRMKALGASDAEIYQAQFDRYVENRRILSEELQKLSDATSGRKMTEEEKQRMEELMKKLEELDEWKRNLDWDYLTEKMKKEAEAAKKAAEARIAAAKKAAEEELLARQAAYKATMDMSGMEMPTENQQGDEEAEQQLIELQALTEYYSRKAEITIANEKDIDEQLLQLDMEYRDRREELLRTRLEDGLITQQEFNNELAQLEIEAAELQIALEEKQTEKTQEQLEKRKKLYESYTKAVKSVTDSLTSILGSVAGTLEEGTQEWKGVMIAKSVIETIAGGITAYMTTMREVGGGVQGIIAGAAAAAAVLATGYAEVAKIRATDVSGSGAGSASGSTNLGSVNPSAVNVNATQVTATRAVQTQEDIANLPDTRVYVTEEDITNAQRRVRVTHENATY